MGRVGWGVLGCGVIGRHHALAVTMSRGAELRAVCDSVDGAAHAMGTEFGVRSYGDYRQMLADPAIQCVSICTPSGMHGEQAILAASGGRHALVEKPIDITLERIDAMIRAHERAGTVLGCVFQSRLTDAAAQAAGLIRSGKLGKLLIGNAYCKWYRSPQYYGSGAWRGIYALDGGGACMNQAIHTIDLLLHLVGDVESIYGYADHLVRKIEVEDTAVAVLKFRSGALGTIEAATSSNPGDDASVEIHGSLGTVVIKKDRMVRLALGATDAQPAAEVELPELTRIESTASDPKKVPLEGHVKHVEDMVEAIREHRDPIVTARSARKPVELILALYRSARTGQEVRLPLE